LKISDLMRAEHSVSCDVKESTKRTRKEFNRKERSFEIVLRV